MGDTTQTLHAQLVMKRDDGTSVLEPPPGAEAGRGGLGDVPKDRAEEIRRTLQDMGFTVEAGNLNTLSIAGPPGLFAEKFGLDMGAKPVAGAVHARSISTELKGYVADVFVAPPPELF